MVMTSTAVSKECSMPTEKSENAANSTDLTRRVWFTEAVESSLLSAVNRLPIQIVDGCRALVNAGGKRLRPELVGASAQAGPTGWSGAVAAAVAVELLHSASLVHDDLLDNSATRRGAPALHRKLGSSSALIAGDALIALSWQLIAESGSQNAMDLGAALSAMCEGQALEEALSCNLEAGSADVLRVAQLKTGALLESACRIGARVGGCTQQQVDDLGMFGRHLGIELQLLDDILDVVSDPELLGKPTGADFRSGLLTMPTVFAASGDRQRDRLRLRRLFTAQINDDEAAEARDVVIASGAVTRTIELAQVYSDRAAGFAVAAGADNLVGLPDQYLVSQLRKVTSDLAVRIGQSRSPGRDNTRSHGQLEHWETERAG